MFTAKHFKDTKMYLLENYVFILWYTWYISYMSYTYCLENIIVGSNLLSTDIHNDRYIHVYQGKNITWNIPVLWTGGLKKITCPLQKLHAQTFRFPGNMQRGVWLVKILILKDRRKYMPAGPVQQKSTCPQSKLTCPGHSGSVMFLPCILVLGTDKKWDML